MRYIALACDDDGTIALDGQVNGETLAALERLRDSGRKLLLVTGRQLNDLLKILPHARLFARIVTENGALLYVPTTGVERLVGEPPPGQCDATWRYHLRRGEYSYWFRAVIKAADLAAEAERIEGMADAPASETCALIRVAIEKRYTVPS